MTYHELLAQVRHVSGVETEAEAERVTAVVFQTLRDRITPNEADDVWAQLPKSWRVLWESGDWRERVTARLRGMDSLDRDEFLAQVQTKIRPDISAEEAVRTVFHALKHQISPGEANDVSAQLPGDLRTLWQAA